MLSKIKSNRTKQIVIYLLFLLLAFILRAPSFYKSVIDWDESVYLLMGRSILEGQIPYVAVWDHKPIGMGVLFAVTQALLGKSVISIRILGCIAVSISGYLLYLIGRTIGKNDKVGLLAGLFYVIYTLSNGGLTNDAEILFTPSNGGLATNVEILFTPFITLAFYLFFSSNIETGVPARKEAFRLFLIGLLFGIALQIKYSVVFDFIALLIIAAICLYGANKDNLKKFFTELFQYCSLLMTGPILIFSAVFLYFIVHKHLPDFIYSNFTANKVYLLTKHFSASFFLQTMRVQIAGNYLWFCFFSLPLYFYFFKEKVRQKKKGIVFLLIWFAGSFLCVSCTKQFYGHYFLQLLPSLCLIGSIITVDLTDGEGGKDIVSKTVIWLFVLFYLFPILSDGFKIVSLMITKKMVFSIIWFAGSFLCFSSTKYYFLQLLPSLCVIGLTIAVELIDDEDVKGTLRKIFISLFILYYLSPMVLDSLCDSTEILYHNMRGESELNKDTPTRISDYLRTVLKKEDYIYIYNYEPIIYYLTRARIPTKYVFPFFLIGDEHSKVTGIDPIEELRSIMRHCPVYVIVKKKPLWGVDNIECHAVLNDYLINKYVFDKSYDDVELYKLKSNVLE